MKASLALFLVYLTFYSFAQQIDSSFAIDGVAPYGGPMANSSDNRHAGNVIVVQPDGKLVIGTDNDYTPINIDYYSYTCRYNIDGSPDSTFGVNGVAKWWVGDNAICNDIKIQPDNKIIMVGESEYCTGGVCGAPQFFMLRLHPNGQIDSSFADDGILVTDELFGTSSTFVYAEGIEILSNGQYIIAGRGPQDSPFVAKLNVDGTKDLTYATNGVFDYASCAYCKVKDVVLDQAENPFILISDQTPPNGQGIIRIAKLDNNGMIDTNFGSNGSTTYSLPSYLDVKSFDLYDDVLSVVGSYEDDAFCIQFNDDGSIHTQFQNEMMFFQVPSDSILDFNRVKVRDENNIIVTGSSLTLDNGQYLYKSLVGLIDEDGLWSPTFNQSGFMILDYGNQGTTGWTGKFSYGKDFTYNNSGELHMTGYRNPLAGTTTRSLLLLKLKNVSYNQPSNLSIGHIEDNSPEVYPNPTSGVLNLPQKVDVTIFDPSGKIVLSENSTKTLDLSHLVNGVYFIETSNSQRIKFIKN